MAILRPLLAETGAPVIGTIVIGTVKGDIHDIGKNLVAMMMEGAGFEVINIGINNDADDFMAAINEHNPELIGMSALLTTTMMNMEQTVQDIRDYSPDTQVYVGGAPLSQEFSDKIGASGYFADPHSFASHLNKDK